MLNIKLEQMRVLVAVADKGAIGEAAQQIGRTPAAISMTLSQIEHQLGDRLFDGERKSRLTPLGQFVLRHARQAVEEHQRALGEIERYASGAQGLSRVAAVPSVATRLLPRAVSKLYQDFPGIHIDLRDIDSAAIHEAVYGGLVDFGIAGRAEDDRLDCDFLLADRFQLFCHSKHSLARLKRPLKWRDLRGQTLIVNDLCRQIQHPELSRLIADSPLFVHNTSSIMAFIESGMGITLLPSMAQPDHQRIRGLPIAGLDARRELFILSRKGRSLSPLDQRLVDSIRQQAAQLALG